MNPSPGTDRVLAALHRMAAEGEPLDDSRDEFAGRVARALAELAGASRVALFLHDDGGLKPLGTPHGMSAEEAATLLSRTASLVIPWAIGRRRLGAILVAGPLRRGGFDEEDGRVLETAAAAAALLWQQRELAAELDAARLAETARMRALAVRMTELEEMKGHILNLAAHELRGPIAVIHGYLSMVSDSSLDGDGLRRILPILLGKVGQMNAQVTQMLDAARLEEGRVELAAEPVDLGQLVREVIEVAGLLAPPGTSVLLERNSTAPVVRGDRVRLATIVSNLVDNAVKYSPDGGLIKCSVTASGHHAEVRVQDSGLGIASEDLPRLFARFGRILTSENSHISGTGLGLYLSLELARMHGGDIVVDSTEGAGSVFTLRLPLADAPLST